MNLLQSCAFGLVFLSLWSRWIIPLSGFWYIPAIVSAVIATTASLISNTALTSSVIVIALTILVEKNAIAHSAMNKFFKILLVLLCVVLALHIVPGYHNINIVHNTVIKNNSVPYSFWLNYDKALAGLVLTVCFVDVAQVATAFQRIFFWTITGTIGSTFLILVPNLAFGKIGWDPGIPYFFMA